MREKGFLQMYQFYKNPIVCIIESFANDLMLYNNGKKAVLPSMQIIKHTRVEVKWPWIQLLDFLITLG